MQTTNIARIAVFILAAAAPLTVRADPFQTITINIAGSSAHAYRLAVASAIIDTVSRVSRVHTALRFSQRWHAPFRI